MARNRGVYNRYSMVCCRVVQWLLFLLESVSSNFRIRLSLRWILLFFVGGKGQIFWLILVSCIHQS